ncbi:MAG TPA: glycosyltransferase [Candidatus Binataceae bacterium]
MRVPRFTPAHERMQRIDLIYFDAGGGHRASAIALKSAAEEQRRPWQIRLVNLREVLEPADVIRRITGVRVEDFYNSLLKSGMTIGTGPMLRIVQTLIRVLHARLTEHLTEYWQKSENDLVVSMIPNFNRAIFQGLRAADVKRNRSKTPMVTILTDLADHPPHFWIERRDQYDQYIVCGTATAGEQAISMGHPRERVFRTSGMIVRPEFYRPMELERETERLRLGLAPELPTGIVMFGSFGSRRMIDIAKRIAAAQLKTQLIFVCGHNEELRRRLHEIKLPFASHCVGFTREIPYFMRMADYFIGKPGPGSISEALVMGLPVIVERNAFTMVQERFNTEWIVQNQLGVVLHSFGSIASGVAKMLDPEQFRQFRSGVKAVDNRAAFEVPEILEEIMSRSRLETAGASRRTQVAEVARPSFGEFGRQVARQTRAAFVRLLITGSPLIRW